MPKPATGSFVAFYPFCNAAVRVSYALRHPSSPPVKKRAKSQARAVGQAVMRTVPWTFCTKWNPRAPTSFPGSQCPWMQPWAAGLIFSRSSVQEDANIQRSMQAVALLSTSTLRLLLLSADMFWTHSFSWPRCFPATSHSRGPKKQTVRVIGRGAVSRPAAHAPHRPPAVAFAQTSGIYW